MSDLVDLDVMVHAETDRAVRVSLDGEDHGAVWLPRSQIEVHYTGRKHNGAKLAQITLPEWLATREGLT